MSHRNVAELLLQTLVAAGVKRVYGIVGDSLNGFTEAIRQSRDLTWIPVRHEEVAAFAAGAEAHLTGSLAVCAGSCGPGNMHLINGLYDCHRSRVPVLAIAAQIPSALQQAFAHEGPALIDVVVNRQELSMPPTIALEQAKGFTLYMIKAVMSGRGNEVLELARSNLWR